MIELIKYVVEQFAERPDAAEYQVEEKGRTVNITVVLEGEDMGKVIGRQGKIAKALRTLANAVGKKNGKKYNIEIKGKNE
ncbi:MAG TPA: RNA-binding protein [Clostridiales bacterium]|nr:RNA-binding protein [Clostridiales bacterium]